MNHHALRLTPSNSPFYKNTSPRSPTKLPKPDEPGLQLRHVIGTTTASSPSFDALPSSRLFAHTAGACAVLAEVETTSEGLTAKQRFYRARPTPPGNSRDGGATPTPNEPRHRALGYVREQSVGGSPLASSGRDWSDSPSGRSTTAKDRVKAATSVALSPNGKWLALGETGYKPRIAIFSLADDSSDSPVATISEHSFGVHALRFSPDSRFLASLGTANDGFLYIWTIDDKSGVACLHASNKLTTFTNVIAWVGDALVTAGLRFIKVWRPDDDANLEFRSPELVSGSSFLAPKQRVEPRASDFGNSILSPRHKTLAGKNTLLGDLLECNFVAVVSISGSEAIICAETGEICLLNDKDKVQTLTLIAVATFAISAARVDESGSLQVLGQEGCSKTLSPEELSEPERPPSRSRRQTVLPARPASCGSASVIATAALGHIIVELDTERVITLRNQVDQSCTQLVAHKEAVQGVKLCASDTLPSARFLTFSANGLIQFWDADGNMDAFLNVPILPAPQQGTPNELKSVSTFVGGTLLASGDKYGVLSIADINTKAIVTQVRAHSAEIMDLCAFQMAGVDFLATAGRDRMSQLFTWQSNQLSLVQTMDEHAGAVTGVLFEQEGRKLVTHSSDRSVVVREAIFREEGNIDSLAFVMLRAIALKSSPTSMCLTGDGELLISTVDRCIGRYKIKNGQCSSNFKCSDTDGGEAAIISKVLYSPSLNGNPAIAGVSSSDKSVRMYTESGSLIARDWGHTEGITDITLIPPDSSSSTARLVTVAADSTIFVWDTVLASPSPPTDQGGLGIVLESSPAMNEVALNPPLRKIISHSDLTRQRRQKSTTDGEPASPTATTGPKSPQRLRKKPSRISTATTPRLEPAFLSVFPDSPRRDSVRHRSPSPPSPRNATTPKPRPSTASITHHNKRRTSLATALRANKSTDNVLSSSNGSKPTTSPTTTLTTGTSTSSLNASTDSITRSLRSYRKRLAAPQHASALLPPAALRELERELRLTMLALGVKAEGKAVDEAALAGLLERVRDLEIPAEEQGMGEGAGKVEGKVSRQSRGEGVDGGGGGGGKRYECRSGGRVDAVAGAMAEMDLEGGREK